MRALNDLPYEDWIDAYNMYKPVMIQLFGGEPTLRCKETLKFMDYVYKENRISEQYPTKISFASNGTVYVDYEEIPKEYRPYILNCFSLDGPERINDKARGKGNYQRTLDAIKRSISAGIPTSINSSCHSKDYLDNLEEYAEWIQYFYDLGVEYVRMQTIFYPYEEDNLIRSEETKQAITALRNLDVVKKYKVEIKDRAVTCYIKGIYIKSNGDFSPKCALMNFQLGNFRNWTLENTLLLNEFLIKNSGGCDDVPRKKIYQYAKGLQLLNKTKGKTNET